MLICIICQTPSANEIIVDGSQGRRKQLARTNEPAVKFLLDTLMTLLLLAELGQLDQSHDLSLENR
jgi:hypothetical protein